MVRLGVAALVLAVQGAAAEAPGGRIFFTSDWQPHFRTSEIFLASAVTGRTTNLTRNEVDDEDPAWSPDGTTIAFRSRRDGNEELYTMRADGSDVRRLTRTPEPESQPAWSPDGTQLAFTSTAPDTEGNQRSAVFVMNRDGTGRRQITAADEDASDPSWSPDGTYLAVQSGGAEIGRIVIVGIDGGGRRELRPVEIGEPAWSPDGTQIAFTHFREQLNTSDVWVIAIDGTNARKVATFASTPAWSPDGSRLAVVRLPRLVISQDTVYEDGGLTVGLAQPDGHAALRNLFARAPRADETLAGLRWNPRGTTYFGVSWAPDGKRLVFGRRTEGRPRDVFSIRADGSHLRNLSRTKWAFESDPTASPDGRYIAYASDAISVGRTLWLARSDGSRRRKVARGAERAAWSPDSRRIAFARWEHGPGSDTGVYVATIGGRRHRIASGSSPSWAPDGESLAFVHGDAKGRYPSSSIEVAAPDGGVRLVAFLPHRRAYDLSWSPDGTRIAFVADHSFEASIVSWVAVVDVATGRVHYLTRGRYEDTSVDWSPRGDWIVFERLHPNVDARDVVYLVRPDGTHVHRLRNSRSDSGPSWSPDGRRLVFTRRVHGQYELYTARPDGSDLRRLTRNLADESEPAWAR